MWHADRRTDLSLSNQNRQPKNCSHTTCVKHPCDCAVAKNYDNYRQTMTKQHSTTYNSVGGNVKRPRTSLCHESVVKATVSKHRSYHHGSTATPWPIGVKLSRHNAITHNIVTVWELSAVYRNTMSNYQTTRCLSSVMRTDCPFIATYSHLVWASKLFANPKMKNSNNMATWWPPSIITKFISASKSSFYHFRLEGRWQKNRTPE